MVDKAQLDPDSQFYLLVDKTHDPNFKTHEATDTEIPPNITIIETTSFTKHQRGSLNDSYGAVWYWDESFTSRMDSLRVQTFGSVTPMDIVTYPHITPSEIASQIRRNNELADKIRNDLIDLTEKGWEIQSNNYSIFIVPPYAHLFTDITNDLYPSYFPSVEDYLEHEQEPNADLSFDQPYRNNIRKELLKAFDKVWEFWIKTTGTEGEIVTGDSFNTDDTRLVRLPVEFNLPYQRRPFYLEAIRLSPGVSRNESILRNLLLDFQDQVDTIFKSSDEN